MTSNNTRGVNVYQDGTDEQGNPMWMAVWDDFINLAESPAQFSSHSRSDAVVKLELLNND